MTDPPDHISHSSRETLLRCAKAYFLSRIAKAPSRPALWLAGGSAVHTVTELYDKHVVAGKPLADFPLGLVWDSSFEHELAEIRRRESNEYKWRWSKTEPIPVWRDMGLQFVRAYIDWRERSDWQIWTTPDGTPAIELDVSGFLPGCEVEIRAYLDRVFYDPLFDRLVVVDLKSGKRPVKSPDQFSTYSALLEVKYDVHATLGVPFMNRLGGPGVPFDLSEFTPESVGAVYGEAWAQIQAGDFPANGFPSACFLCDVSAACALRNGPLAKEYDPDHPEFVPY